MVCLIIFFFSSRRRHTRFDCDWSSDVCSSDLKLSTAGAAFREVPSGGLSYLGTASYREMEKWALPPTAQKELAKFEEDLGPKRLEKSASFVRGGHWHHFLVKYPESNRMHKTMLAVSSLSRSRGDPPGARRAIGRAQCNDAYWHGVVRRL